MKKYKCLLLVLLLTVCLLFSGCNKVGTVGFAQNSDGTITEFYIIPYAEQEMINYGLTEEESKKIKKQAQQQLDTTFAGYIENYKVRIDANEKYSESQKKYLKEGITISNSFINKTEQNFTFNLGDGSATPNDYITYIRYELYFKDSTCYKEFKNANDILSEEKVIVEENHFFTTTTKVIKDPIFDKIKDETITLSNYLVGAIKGIILNVMAGENPTQETLEATNNRWSIISNGINFDEASKYFTYCYIVPSARIKSNAQQVVYQDGYYWHMWQIKSDNSSEGGANISFEYWTVTANKYVWYCFAVLGAVVVMLIVYLKSRKQEKQEIENLTKDDKINTDKTNDDNSNIINIDPTKL